MSISPLDDFRALFAAFPEEDKFSVTLVKKKVNELLYPNSSLQKHTLGKFEDLITWLAGWRGYDRLNIKKPSIALFAGSQVIHHNADNVKKLVQNLQTGGGFINELCQSYDISLKIYDLALDYPVMDMRYNDAIDEKSCAATMAFGMEAIAGDIDILGLSSINTSEQELSEACIAQLLLGGEVEHYLSIQHDKKCINELKQIIADFKEKDSFKILQKFGTRELSAMCGAIIAAHVEKVPVVLEGHTALLAAALLKNIKINAIEHCIIGQITNTPFYNALKQYLDIPVLMNLEMNNDCGAGLAFAISALRTSVLSFIKLHSFEKATELLAK